MSAAVRTAVIAAAGLGTRFLPQTKAMPKEMLPVVDRPVIQYIVEELVEAGVQDIVIVTGHHKRAIEDHFDSPTQELVQALDGPSKSEALMAVDEIAGLANFCYVRQKGPQGNATPLLNAARIVGDEPFIYTFGDDFITASPGRFRQMSDTYREHGAGVLSCIRATQPEDYDRYGFVGGDLVAEGLLRLESIVEKPGANHAPSDLASVSSYLFPPEFFDALRTEHANLREGAELSLQAAMQRYLDDGNTLLALEIANARYHDSGNKLEYLKTVIQLGLEHPEIGDSLYDYLLDTVRDHKAARDSMHG